MFMDWKTQYCSGDNPPPQLTYKFKAILIKIPVGSFAEADKLIAFLTNYAGTNG